MAITVFLTDHGRRASALTFLVVFVAVCCAYPEGLALQYPRELGKGWIPRHGLPPRAQTKRNAASENFHSAHAVQVGRDSDEVCGFLARRSKEMYIVRHNYGGSVSLKKQAYQMEHVILPGEERGYRVTTDKVNFEFGFAYKNLLTNEWLYEIGAKNKAPLSSATACSVGKFFNRVMTIEDPDSDIEYVWGSCDRQCSAEDEDTSYTLQEPTGDIPACEDGNVNSGVEIGEGDGRATGTVTHGCVRRGRAQFSFRPGADFS